MFFYRAISTCRFNLNGIYLVTLPIGNHEDITIRALNTLKETKMVYCEDTRVFKDLCRKLEIIYSDKKIISLHDHSDDRKVAELIEHARSMPCVFVSDAGSPIVSDPAFPIVKSAIKNDVPIYSIGGISSIICALELSGLAPIPFHFHGFLARDKSKRSIDFENIHSQYGTHILFEGVSRVLDTLEVLTKEFSESDFVVARELTKEFESVYRFNASEFDNIKADIYLKGEFVILISNQNKSVVKNSDLVKYATEILDKGAKPKTVAKLVSQILDLNSKDVYQKIGR